MARYILDGNVLSEIEDQSKPGFSAIMEKLDGLLEEDEVCISIISAFEYEYGITKAPEPLKISLKKSWESFMQDFAVLPLSMKCARIFGEIRSEYERHTGAKTKESQKHVVDFILASTAIEMDAAIVSDDKIFKIIQRFYPSLKVENWKEK
jgi:predicted nucleic acid-binding protein